MLKQQLDPRVRVFTVWQPKQGGTEADVAEATATMPDYRARHYWDGEGLTLRTFARTLAFATKVDSWDLYLLYAPGTRWDGPLPPVPTFWMHQLWDVPHGPLFDRQVFADHLAQTLAATAP